MADQQEGQEQVRCSSSESDNFEKIDSDEVVSLMEPLTTL